MQNIYVIPTANYECRVSDAIVILKAAIFLGSKTRKMRPQLEDSELLRNIGKRAAKPTVAIAKKERDMRKIAFCRRRREQTSQTALSYSYHEGIPRGEFTRMLH
nr:unnamed protein product [Spirometra erinaceieuropaei]